MKEMTDRELTDKISQVFDNFEDPTAEHGWKELRKKYPESEQKPVPLWWAAAAAALIILCGLWFIVPDTALEDQKALKKSVQKGHNDPTVSDAIGTPNQPETYQSIPGGEAAKNTTNAPGSTLSNNITPSAKYDKPNQRSAERTFDTSIPEFESVGTPDRISLTKSQSAGVLNEQNSLSNSSILSLPSLSSSIAVLSPEILRDSLLNISAKLLALAPANSTVDNHTHKVEQPGYKSQKTTAKDHSLSVYAGSYFNYSLGSETKLNFGAGFTSDIKLASNLRLSTGLALAKNSLTYNNGVPSSSNAKLAYDALPAFGTGNGGAVSSSLTTVTRYNADILALDIPVNIKYLIIPQDNKFYLVAGLSSGTYLTEKYSLDYRNYSLAGSLLSQGQGVESKNNLQAFDIARTLNISFGYSAILGKTQNITIEPFLKYPLGGLGSEELKFGATGINLKLNFSKIRK